MKFRLREIIVDEMFVLAAVSAWLMAASRALQLSRFSFVVAAAFVFLVFTVNFWWDLRGEAYKKLGGLGRAIMVLVIVMVAASVVSARSSPGLVHSLFHKSFYLSLALLITIVVIDRIRQNRENQTVRSVKDNGTV